MRPERTTLSKAFVIDGVTASDGDCHSVGDNDYDCYSIGHGQRDTVTFNHTLKTAGNQTVHFGFAYGMDPDTGTVDPNRMLDTPDLSMDVAINP